MLNMVPHEQLCTVVSVKTITWHEYTVAAVTHNKAHQVIGRIAFELNIIAINGGLIITWFTLRYGANLRASWVARGTKSEVTKLHWESLYVTKRKSLRVHIK